MSIRKLPGSPIPHITKARNTRGSMGSKGAICLIVLGILLYVALDYIINFMDDFVLPDIGIPYPLLFVIFIGCVILVIVVFTLKDTLKGGIVHGSRIGTRVTRVRDPSVCKRIIKDGYDGPEFIVMGDGNITFGQACRDNWQFMSVRKNSGWFIKDERGNDVTDMSLFSFDGICTLFPEYGSEKKKTDSDESLYSIHDSVTYYD